MRRFVALTLVLALAAGTAQAQRPRRSFPARPSAPLPQDSARPRADEPMPGQDDPRRQMLRERVEANFGRMVQADLELTDDQMTHVRQAMRANQDRRIAMARREQDLRREIQRQIERGGSADNDSVARLTDAISRLRIERAQSDDQLVRDLGFLPPMKRARLLLRMQRFEQQVQDIRRRAQMGQRPGMMQRP